MIDMKNQWAIQIDVTNACNRACSNCTRFVGHFDNPFFMTVKQFEEAVTAVKDFPTESPAHHTIKDKMIGIIGGEPLLHPNIIEIFEIFEQLIPNRINRGLWTGLRWEKTRFSKIIERVFGFVNNNLHDSSCHHSPVLASISSLVPDLNTCKDLIDKCWLQETWCGTITPRGLFFCEVAGSWDILLDGPGGLPIEPGCWKRPLSDFQDQIDRFCYGCGVPLQMQGRLDSEGVDDITLDNLEKLGNSPRIKTGKYKICYKIGERISDPWQYRK